MLTCLTYQVNATDFGHVSACNPAAAGASGLICADPPKSADQSLYRRELGALIVNFLGGIFESDSSKLKLLETESAIGVSTILQHDYHGYSLTNITGFCREFP